jgi:dTDP-4-amino-4,6-dideoxygalactose transaminase
VHDSFGTNWRMLEMQAAIGLVQLDRMPKWTARRTQIAQALTERLARHPAIRLSGVPNYANHAYYRLYAFVRPDGLVDGWSRDRIIEEIVSRGVPCMHGSQSEVYLERAFDGTGWRPQQRLPAAQELGETGMAFLVHPTLTDDEVAKTSDVIDEVMTVATRR